MFVMGCVHVLVAKVNSKVTAYLSSTDRVCTRVSVCLFVYRNLEWNLIDRTGQVSSLYPSGRVGERRERGGRVGERGEREGRRER